MKAFFLTIPHSGERIPAETPWLHGLPESIVMCDVDRYVDRLYQPTLEALELAHIKAEWHRYVVDLNRLPDDIDADAVKGSVNPAGKFPMGLHWTKTTRGTRLMPEPMTMALHQALIARYFEPFHQEVRGLYEFFKGKGASTVYHLDAHSMPSKGTAGHRDPGQTRAEIVVSDWEGKSCSTEFKDLVITAYTRAGLKVAYNWPYLGGRVTQTYGQPMQGQHAIQVEINRALYMDEESKELRPELAKVLSEKIKSAVTTIQAELAEI